MGLVVSVAVFIGAETQAQMRHANHDLGVVNFPVSCSKPAQNEFTHAVALLHHMTYPQAREAFQHVETIDSRCAMAYWGEAMTLFQPLWPTRPSPAALQQGWDAVQKAKSLQPPTQREQLFIAAAEAFFLDPTSKDYWLRIRRWEAAMEKLYNAFPNDPMQIRGGWELDIGELWSMAALTPKDVDFVQTYDDYPVISMMQFEDLGFCAKGAGPDFVRSHTLTNDGTFPHNTSGGQLSVGQAGAAGGFLGLVEAMRQLTSQPLGSQVPNANACLVSGFGMINYDRGLSSCAAVLARAA